MGIRSSHIEKKITVMLTYPYFSLAITYSMLWLTKLSRHGTTYFIRRSITNYLSENKDTFRELHLNDTELADYSKNHFKFLVCFTLLIIGISFIGKS